MREADQKFPKFPPPGPFQLEAARDRAKPSATFLHQRTISGVKTFNYGKNLNILSFYLKNFCKTLLCLPEPMKQTCLSRFLLLLASLLALGSGSAMAFSTVVIDPGHGGADLGAADSYVYEKHINLDVARRLERSLKEAGFKTIMTRSRDEFIALSERSSMANRQRNAIFVSVHFNSSYRTAALGIETFYRSSNSEKLAQAVQRELIKNTRATDRGVKTANFSVLRETKHPSVLVEGGFVSNKEERSAMCDPIYRQVVADSIARAVVQFSR